LHTSLVRFHFSRSATGEGGGKEGQHDGAFADEIGEVDDAAIG